MGALEEPACLTVGVRYGRVTVLLGVLLVAGCGRTEVAVPAPPGHVVGTAVLLDTTRVLLTGSVRVRRLGRGTWSETVHASRGHFGVALRPGRYALTATEPNIYCSTATVTVRPRSSVTATTVCQMP
jgi:hypothetical protein